MDKMITIKTKIGGVIVNTELVDRVIEVLLSFDRMENNPDVQLLRETVENLLNTEGIIKLVIFACPKFKTSALLTDQPENYMPTGISPDDLFAPRIPKIKELRQKLWDIGVICTVDVFIGDDDYQKCLRDSLQVNMDMKRLNERIERYARAFDSRLQKELQQSYTTWSFSELGVSLTDKEIDDDALVEAETEFFRWLFGPEGPYKGTFRPDQKAIQNMVLKTLRLYGAQGLALDELFPTGAVLLRTGRPSEWLQGTNTFRWAGGLSNIPAIYPYIRSES
jgi:hypothetical protein